MRTGLCGSCVASILKLLIFFQAFVGVSVVIYSAWVLDHWYRREDHGLGTGLGEVPPPWFGYAMLVSGIVVCLIAFVGHVAVEAVSGCCLCFYTIFATILILLEAALVGFMALDKHWEEDLPKDTTGELERLRAFIEANIDIFKWVGVAVIVIQALSLFFATILRALVSPRHGDYDSDDEFNVTRQPLLHPQYTPKPVLGTADGKGAHSDVWSSRMRQKYSLNQGEYLSVTVDPKASPSV